MRATGYNDGSNTPWSLFLSLLPLTNREAFQQGTFRRCNVATAYILDAVRSPRGRGKAGKGALSGVHPQELLAQTLNRLAQKSGIDKKDVEDVVVGVVTQVNEQGANPARNAVLAAGWPEHVTGVVLNRFCGSGAQAVNFAAMAIMAGQ